ncbi:ATP-dependent helicase HrpB [Mesobaculum littorinae]|uniref:ATP-dependent helicase HrpB n=1 Tax=Mesobaculum littorinae TaxID=2486419 RepID=A0A438AK59_9RHOB|nr:ATP-dependent helicase HrpB [Mesobaculum littorinae]RVV99201.1 ATP-dependent helicase HrpB [Mesobaculum littorinae]
MTRLPIEDALPDLLAALDRAGRAVLQAPPGAGKTTRVPLALLDRQAARGGDSGPSPSGRILLLEPRRLAARTAAQRMAETLGEAPGQRVGYRIRGEQKVSKATRIEVVTEGILTRMLQTDPELSGVGMVIFDEFHERSLDADLGLALCLEIRGALRPDLQLLVMSATLDAGPVAALMEDAPLVTSEGRAFPVETVFATAPLPRGRLRDAAVADRLREIAAETEGGILVFLPGEREIRGVAAGLQRDLPRGVVVQPLYGALPHKAQQAAITPLDGARKLVLATSIAETSLTIPDIRVVVDAGLARRARFDPGSGMSRLVTERVTRAEADQRRGRAGRVAPGVCYRLWTRGEDGALAAFPPAGIEAADLTRLALELALWGVSDPADLPFLTQPPAAAFDEARALLRGLGALDETGLTPHGRRLAGLPLHPRLAHMLQIAGGSAADLAALLSERDILKAAPADMTLRLAALTDKGRSGYDSLPAPRARVQEEARRLSRAAPPGDAEEPLTPAQAAALAYPDRIALHRPGEAPRFLLSGGKGARIDPADPLAGSRLLVVTDTDGDPREARIRQAFEIGEAALRAVPGMRPEWVDVCTWSRRAGRVVARQQERLGALVLDDRTWADAPRDAVARAMLEGVREIGLIFPPGAARFRARVALLRETGDAGMPDLSDAALMARIEDWLLPYLGGVRSAADWRRFDPEPALRAQLDWEAMQRLDREVPGGIDTPLSRTIPVDYAGEAPEIAVRLQEMFGVTRHPTVAGRPLRVTLLSPAGRALQTTMDLPRFWRTSYADVRKDMRGRYPKHPWPEDPTQAEPTLRAKPRK